MMLHIINVSGDQRAEHVAIQNYVRYILVNHQFRLNFIIH